MPAHNKRRLPQQKTYLARVDLPEILDTNTISRYLGVSEMTVRNWRKLSDPLPAICIGGTVRFNRDDLFEWIKRHTQAEADPAPAAR